MTDTATNAPAPDEAPAPPRVRYVWTLIDPPAEQSIAELIVWLTFGVFLSWLALACCFVADGAAPYVLRWAAVNGVATALWCLAFVRREVAP